MISKSWIQSVISQRPISTVTVWEEHPSFDLFVKLITMFDVSVDQFIHADGGARSSSCRKHIDVLLNSMNEKELVVIEATACLLYTSSFCLFTQHQIQPPNNAVFRPLPSFLILHDLSLIHI